MTGTIEIVMVGLLATLVVAGAAIVIERSLDHPAPERMGQGQAP